jgi:hypothetical protein
MTTQPEPDAPTAEFMALMKEQLTAIQQSFAQALQDQQAAFRQEIVSLKEEIQTIRSRPSSPTSAKDPSQLFLGPHATDKSGNGSKTVNEREHLPIPTVKVTPPASSTGTTLAVPPTPKSDRLPDPPMFKGKRKDLPIFIRKLRYKLEGNADRYPTERSQLLYAHSRIEGDPVTLVDPLMDQDIHSVDQLIAFLQTTYGDPNRKLTALSKLDALRQDRKNFTTHFAEFRRLAADTGLNEIGLITQLRRSLNDDLRRAMVGVKIPDTLNDYANLIASYDNDLRYLPSRRPSRPQHMTQRDPNAMEIDTSNYAPFGSAERERRRKLGLCFKCGKPDHISRYCSVPMPKLRSNSLPGMRPSSDFPAPLSRNTPRRASSSSSSSSDRSRGRSPSRRPRTDSLNTPSRR